MTKRSPALALACAAAFLTCATSSFAEEYPAQPIKVVIPNPPGGPGDVISRVFTEKAAVILGKPFVYDYKPGATTTIGTALAAKAEPDGYTILGLPSSGVGATALRTNMRYDLVHDFVPIAGIGTIPLVLVVRSGLNLNSMKDFTAAARKGKLLMGSAGVGTIGHLTSLLLIKELKGTATHVPFRGNPQTLQAVLGGQIDFCFVSVSDAAPFLKEKEIKILATTAGHRLNEMPDVPTMTEVGLPDVNSSLWYGYLAPKNTPADRVTKLFHAFADVGKDPSTEKQLKNFGFIVEMTDPDQLGQKIRQEAARWKKVVEENGIKPEE